MVTKRRTTAWMLAWLCVLVIVYASLYPFEGWRNQAIEPWFFVGAPWYGHNTWFDLISNVLGYMPLGFWWCLAAMRSGVSRRRAWVFTALACSALSFAMECTQSFLPMRVPSQLDWGLNSAGGWLGAMLALVLEQRGGLYRWSQFRAVWLRHDASGSLVLLVLWPLALLYPVSVPLGLGSVAEPLSKVWLESPWGSEAPLSVWLEAWSLTASPVWVMVCVMLGLWVPGLLAMGVCRQPAQQLLAAATVALLAFLGSGLSAALTYGPVHAWHWLTAPVVSGLALGLLLLVVSVRVPRLQAPWVMVCAQGVGLVLLNLMPVSAYFEQTMQTWEQGRFIRFHGLTPWLNWSWPWLLLVWMAWSFFGAKAHKAAT